MKRFWPGITVFLLTTAIAPTGYTRWRNSMSVGWGNPYSNSYGGIAYAGWSSEGLLLHLGLGINESGVSDVNKSPIVFSAGLGYVYDRPYNTVLPYFLFGVSRLTWANRKSRGRVIAHEDYYGPTITGGIFIRPHPMIIRLELGGGYVIQGDDSLRAIDWPQRSRVVLAGGLGLGVVF